MKKVRIFLLSFLLVTLSSTTFAQNNTSALRVKRDIKTVIFSSLAGGILGLSTLSFYGKPEEHTVNITTGILIGFVGGLSYVAYDRSRPQARQTEFYSEMNPLQKPPTIIPVMAWNWEY